MTFDSKTWGIVLVMLAAVGGVFGWWAYQSAGAGSFGITLENNNNLDSPTSGEVAHWTFDGKDINTTFNDVSGSGNNATSTAFTSTTTAIGRIGQGLAFNSALSQYLSNNATAFNFERTDSFSIAAWIKRTDTAGRHAIFGKAATACGPGYVMEIEDAAGSGAVAGNTLQLWLYNGTNNLIASTVQNTVLAGKWYHVAATYNGSSVLTGVKLYINGTQMTIDPGSYDTLGANTILNTAPPTIGAECGGFTSWFNGTLDDVRVYNRVLSPQEVSRLYGLGTAAVATTPKTNPAATNGEVGHWTFDGKDINTTFNDVSGSGNNATSTAFPSTTTIQGRVGQGLLFNSALSQYLTINATAFNFEQTNSFSIAAWVKKSDGASRHAIFAKEGGACGPGYRLELGDNAGSDGSVNGIGFLMDSGANEVLVVSYSDNIILPHKWYHVVATYNGTGVAAGVQLYVNGTVVTPFVSHDSLGASSILTTAPPTIGADCAGGQDWFTGTLDDVRVYNRVLSPIEVSRLYGLGTAAVATTPKTNPATTNGEVGHWTFDGKDINTTFNDVSGSGNNATSTAFTSTTTIEGRVGQGLSFNQAVAQYLTSRSTDFNFERTNSFSIAAWVKLRDQAARSSIFGKEGSACGPGYYMQIENAAGSDAVAGSSLQLWLDNGSNNLIASTVQNTVLAGKWYHVAATYNGTSVLAGVKLYINGIQMPIDPGSFDTLGANTILNTAAATIGASCNGASGWFNGTLDDVRVYNRVLSPLEVSRLYGLGQ